MLVWLAARFCVDKARAAMKMEAKNRARRNEKLSKSSSRQSHIIPAHRPGNALPGRPRRLFSDAPSQIATYPVAPAAEIKRERATGISNTAKGKNVQRVEEKQDKLLQNWQRNQIDDVNE